MRPSLVQITDILVENRVLTPEQVQLADKLCASTGKSKRDVLIDRGLVTEEQYTQALSEKMDLPYILLSGMTVDEDILKLFDSSILKKHIALPFSYADESARTLRVAFSDPMNMTALDDLALLSGKDIEPYVATATDILANIDRYYGSEEVQNVAEQYAKERESAIGAVSAEDFRNAEDLSTSPIVQLVNSMIEQAARMRASDIHVEVLQDSVRVRYRIDGVMYNKMRYALQLFSAIVTRIKIMGGMDISEKRKPLDGRITVVVDRKEYDIRVSTLPTVFGEKVVMRLAMKQSLSRDKRHLGLNDEEMTKFDHILSNPHGIVLVTGPTGSGKSTTLYTALSELNSEEVNIVTVEDPVEANIDGINQVQVNPKADLTFATALRSILRQDPDIIMIGEIRDTETAEIAVQASITGHLVVSTLHTNSTANTVTRLIDMGIESFLIADSVVGIIAQRLVRRLCPHCKKGREAEDYELEFLGRGKDEKIEIFEPCGCPRCNETGYYERIGVYEILEVTPQMKKLISRKGTADQIKELAVSEGMHTLRESASRLVVEGITSISELLKVSFET